MDIEEYLRQKKELEAKKELLEAKQRLKEAKTFTLKKGKEAGNAPQGAVERGHQGPEASQGALVEGKEVPIATSRFPVWGFVIAALVVGGVLTYFFYPRIDEETLRAKILAELKGQGITGAAVTDVAGTPAKDSNAGEEPQADGADGDSPDNGVTPEDEGSDGDELPVKEVNLKPGPKFDLWIKDPEAGYFDDNGKIAGGKILEVHGSSYYKDYLLGITNKEKMEIVCKLDKEVIIHDFDNPTVVIDTDINLDYSIEELSAGEDYSRKESAPGTTDKGKYPGKGFLDGSYEARCYFCLNKECKEDQNTPIGYDPQTETKQTAAFKVVVYGVAEDLTGTGNSTL